MRLLTFAAAVLCVAGCAGQPPAAKQAMAPERIKGPYKVVMRGDKKLYCSKELATGSHVNYRTICLTPEEYAEIERQSREWKDVMNSGINPSSGPGGTGPGQNPLTGGR
jgi:hypothetical protein